MVASGYEHFLKCLRSEFGLSGRESPWSLEELASGEIEQRFCYEASEDLVIVRLKCFCNST